MGRFRAKKQPLNPSIGVNVLLQKTDNQLEEMKRLWIGRPVNHENVLLKRWNLQHICIVSGKERRPAKRNEKTFAVSNRRLVPRLIRTNHNQEIFGCRMRHRMVCRQPLKALLKPVSDGWFFFVIKSLTATFSFSFNLIHKNCIIFYIKCILHI